MAINVGGRRSNIVSLISRDLQRKEEQKKRKTAADLLKERMGIVGKKDVAETQREGMLERERLAQSSATARQGMVSRTQTDVQKLRSQGLATIQSMEGRQNIEGLREKGRLASTFALEEEARSESEAKKAMDLVNQYDTDDAFEYDLNLRKKKKEEGVLAFPAS